MRIEISDRADCDLEDIYQYSARQFGEAQAEKYYWSLWDTFRVLAANPFAGRKRVTFSPPLRSHHHQKHVIFYRVCDDHILIVRVLHERMDPERHL